MSLETLLTLGVAAGILCVALILRGVVSGVVRLARVLSGRPSREPRPATHAGRPGSERSKRILDGAVALLVFAVASAARGIGRVWKTMTTPS